MASGSGGAGAGGGKTTQVQVSVGGGQYKGGWLGGADGAPQGWGVSRDPEGNIYTGLFERGVPQGRGSHLHASGERYDGGFQAGKKHGVGVWSHPAGDKYYGQYHTDLRHGFGTYINAGGDKFEGEWERDRPKRRCPLPEDVKRFIAETEIYGELPDRSGGGGGGAGGGDDATDAYGDIAATGRPGVARPAPAKAGGAAADGGGKKKLIVQTNVMQIYGETPYGGLVYDRASAKVDDDDTYSTVTSAQARLSFKVKDGPPPAPPPNRAAKPPQPPAAETDGLPDSYFEVGRVEDPSLASEVDGMYLDVDLRRIRPPEAYLTREEAGVQGARPADDTYVLAGRPPPPPPSSNSTTVTTSKPAAPQYDRGSAPSKAVIYDRGSTPSKAVVYDRAAPSTKPVYDTASAGIAGRPMESVYGEIGAVAAAPDSRGSTLSTTSSSQAGPMERIREPALRPAAPMPGYAQPLTVASTPYDSPRDSSAAAAPPPSRPPKNK